MKVKIFVVLMLAFLIGCGPQPKLIIIEDTIYEFEQFCEGMNYTIYLHNRDILCADTVATCWKTDFCWKTTGDRDWRGNINIHRVQAVVNKNGIVAMYQ